MLRNLIVLHDSSLMFFLQYDLYLLIYQFSEFSKHHFGSILTVHFFDVTQSGDAKGGSGVSPQLSLASIFQLVKIRREYVSGCVRGL